MPRARPRKNTFFFEKSDAWACCPVNGFGAKSAPKRHPKIMKKSTPKKYAEMMAKGSKRDGKWSRNGIQNHAKSLQNSMSKNDRTIMEKNMKNEGVEP